MSKKYVPLGEDTGKALDDTWKAAVPPHIDGLGSHAGIPGLITVSLKDGKKLRLNLRQTESGELLLGFDS
jgi:hypothetical protein